MGKYIDFRYFLVSLAIGLLYIYISDDHRKVMILYPTPDNIKEYQYKDKTDTVSLTSSKKRPVHLTLRNIIASFYKNKRLF